MPGRRTKKAPKDPHAPKKPLSAYFLFSNERRPILRQKHSELKITEISKLIAKEWKELAQDIKTEYQNRSKKDKIDYNTAYEQYKQTDQYKKFQKILQQFKQEQALTSDHKKKKSRKGKPKKPKKPESYPKIALSAYFLYQNDRRQILKVSIPGIKTTEITQKVAKEWKALDNEEKSEYFEKSKRDKEIFEKQMQSYKETSDYKTYIELEKEYKLKLKQWNATDNEISDDDDSKVNNGNAIKLKLPKKPKDVNAPKKPGTGYLLFSNEKRSQLVAAVREKGEKPVMKIIQKKIGEMWKSLDNDGKQMYQQKVNELKAEYETKLKEYQQSDEYQEYLRKVEEWQKLCVDKKKAHQLKLRNLKTNNNNNSNKKRAYESSDDSSSDGSGSDDSSSEDSSSDESSDESSD